MKEEGTNKQAGGSDTTTLCATVQIGPKYLWRVAPSKAWRLETSNLGLQTPGTLRLGVSLATQNGSTLACGDQNGRISVNN